MGAALLVGAALLGGASACVPDNHPLGTLGAVAIIMDTTHIYAADVLDEDGKAVLPRQKPYQKRVQLYLSSGSAPDQGAYVDVQLDPPHALLLLPDDDSCEQLSGSFRCTGQDDGFASFWVRSESDFSGKVVLKIAGRTNDNKDIQVDPAGIPTGTTNFTMLTEGITADTVPARYNALKCTLEPVPDSGFDKWPVGATRVREAEVRASAPSTNPTVINHAPVIIETLHPEAFVTLDPTCPAPRDSRLRVQLDELGRSPKFYFCFSDIGGTLVELSYSSGSFSEKLRLTVKPEPRLLRVVTEATQLTTSSGEVSAVAVSAFDADLKKVSFTVDVTSDNPLFLKPKEPTAVLPVHGEVAKLLTIVPLQAGQAHILVAPELHDAPVCKSELITVTEGL